MAHSAVWVHVIKYEAKDHNYLQVQQTRVERQWVVLVGLLAPFFSLLFDFKNCFSHGFNLDSYFTAVLAIRSFMIWSLVYSKKTSVSSQFFAVSKHTANINSYDDFVRPDRRNNQQIVIIHHSSEECRKISAVTSSQDSENKCMSLKSSSASLKGAFALNGFEFHSLSTLDVLSTVDTSHVFSQTPFFPTFLFVTNN